MLEVYHEIVQAIAEMPTRHSWAVQLMKLPVEQADRAESKVDDWIEETVMKEYPDTFEAERYVRAGWLNLLEGEAIEAYMVEHPEHARALTPLFSPGQAVNFAAMDLPYAPMEKDVKAAKDFLTKMMKGERKPDLEKILGTI